MADPTVMIVGLTYRGRTVNITPASSRERQGFPAFETHDDLTDRIIPVSSLPFIAWPAD